MTEKWGTSLFNQNIYNDWVKAVTNAVIKFIMTGKLYCQTTWEKQSIF